MLFRAIDIIQARNNLHLINVVSYPHVKKESQSKLYKKYHKIAYPDNGSKSQSSTLDLVKLMAGKNGQ